MAGPTTGPEILAEPPQPRRRLIARRLNRLRQLHDRRSRSEVFPWMEHSAAVCAIIGAILGAILGQGATGPILGAMVGAGSGILLALSWASDVPGMPASPAPEQRDLWDPWLDEDRVVEIEEVQIVEEVVDFDSGRPRVRPRVSSSSAGNEESLPLEDRIGPIFADHERGAIGIHGPNGSGKTTALAYLARLIPPHLQVTFLDQPEPWTLKEASDQGRVVYAAATGAAPTSLAFLRLAPWGEDEWIEYVLSADRNACASVMARLKDQNDELSLLGGLPELWTIVLDQMIADESISGPRQALRAEFDHYFADPVYRKQIERDCLDALTLPVQTPSLHLDCLRRHEPDEALFRLIRHRTIQLLLAADCLADDLAEGQDCEVLRQPMPRDLVREAGTRIVRRPQAVERLRQLIVSHNRSIQPMVASLLHATGLDWCPSKPTPCLKGAYLNEARWAGVILVDGVMNEVDLRRADLWGARLDGTVLVSAHLGATDLRTASLSDCQFQRADLSRARLAKAQAQNSNFQAAILAEADLEAAILDESVFQQAHLTNANLVDASLVGANLTRARIEGADFSRTNLHRAILRELKLTGARFDGARFTEADLSDSDLEEMVLPLADFSGANLSRALLTGSTLRNANFRQANLQEAGLANVEWERADLRGADLRRAAFHLGSSRSGLVNSTIASEGSRTGFYTDDYNDQDFKSPEEIRKANLQGVDLRGAKIAGVDFYLVDLRGAKVDPEQLVQLRQTGAILESRA